MNQQIFISMASYLDPMLFFTLADAVRQAARPDLLRFAVVDQHISTSAPPFACCRSPVRCTAAAVVKALLDLDTDPVSFSSPLTGVAAATDITSIEASNGSGSIVGTALTAINGNTLTASGDIFTVTGQAAWRRQRCRLFRLRGRSLLNAGHRQRQA